mmetsp:Transcript_10412/g.17023  ORF Transcript_10412/g.17023 Transcript_10412/m.17023 type:complete len:257 (-) Transcript_10412:660-1430(-)
MGVPIMFDNTSSRDGRSLTLSESTVLECMRSLEGLLAQFSVWPYLQRCINRARFRIRNGELKEFWGKFLIVCADSDEIFSCGSEQGATIIARRIDSERPTTAFPFIVPYGAPIQYEKLCGAATHPSAGVGGWPLPMIPVQVSAGDTMVIKSAIFSTCSTITALPFDILVALGRRPTFMPGFVQPLNTAAVVCCFRFGPYDISIGNLSVKRIPSIYGISPGARAVAGEDLLDQYHIDKDIVKDSAASWRAVQIIVSS